MAIRKLTGKQLKSFRSDVAKLKKLGLLSKKVDARAQQPTRYMRNLTEKRFAAVLDGKAATVKVSDKETRNKFKPVDGIRKGLYDVKNGYVIVPIEQGQTRPRFNKKTKQISGYVELYGRKTKRTYAVIDKDFNPDSFNSENTKFVVQAAWGQLASYDNFADLEAFMSTYENRKNPFLNWREYVQIQEYGDDGENDEI